MYCTGKEFYMSIYGQTKGTEFEKQIVQLVKGVFKEG